MKTTFERWFKYRFGHDYPDTFREIDADDLRLVYEAGFDEGWEEGKAEYLCASYDGRQTL